MSAPVADRLRRPPLDRRVVDERERVSDRDPLEAETAQQPVGRRHERRAVARAPVEGVPDHDAAETRPDRGPVRREILRANARVDMRLLVGRHRRRPEAGEVLRARGPSQAAREGDGEPRRAELPRPERPVGRVEYGREVGVDAGRSQPARGGGACRERLVRADEHRAAENGGAPGSAFTAPPSWSAKVMPAAPPKMPGSRSTTRSAAFCCGVRASASARAASTSGRLRRPRQGDAEGRAFAGRRFNRERAVRPVDDLQRLMSRPTRNQPARGSSRHRPGRTSRSTASCSEAGIPISPRRRHRYLAVSSVLRDEDVDASSPWADCLPRSRRGSRERPGAEAPRRYSTATGSIGVCRTMRFRSRTRAGARILRRRGRGDDVDLLDVDSHCLAGAGGFEPPYGGIKIHCLTTWRRPNNRPGKRRRQRTADSLWQRRSIEGVGPFQQAKADLAVRRQRAASCVRSDRFRPDGCRSGASDSLTPRS